MVRYEYLDDISHERWMSVVRESKQAYFFHAPAWARVLEEAYGYRNATRLYEVDGSDVLIPMVEKERYGLITCSSMPFGYGGLLSRSDVPAEAIRQIVSDIVGGRRLTLHLSLPPFADLPMPGGLMIAEGNGEWGYTHLLPLHEGFLHIWKHRFRQDARRQVRQAERYGVEVVDGRTQEDVRAFYGLYAESSRRWGYKEPPQPMALYERLLEVGPPQVRLKLAMKDGTAIGGMVNLYYGQNAFGFASASSRESAKYRPSALLVKVSIEEACEDGYACFNLGASGSLEGVRRFKEDFGARQVGLREYRVASRLCRVLQAIRG
ncbi:MAG: GNAT family N-acetyltransferase [Methanomicrobiaceae archaeon]|nr:GNAT family N-acetyltransferase [Methanomicrobiaceae archaeon]